MPPDRLAARSTGGRSPQLLECTSIATHFAAAPSPGDAAPVTAELTGARVKPAASTSSTFSAVMPPIAKAGRRISAATWREQFDAGKRVERLRRRGKGRAHADVIGAVEHRGAGLLDRMGRHADELARPDDRPGILDAHVVLAQVDAIGVDDRGDVGAVVDDE